MSKTIAEIEAGVYRERLERVREFVADAKMDWPRSTPAERLDGILGELDRITDAAADIVYMTPDEVFSNSSWIFDGVLFLGEEGNAAIIRGHVPDRRDAIAMVDRGQHAMSGDHLRDIVDDDSLDAIAVKHTHGVFFAALPDEEFDWWCRTVDEPVDGRTEPITWVDLW